MNEWDKWALGRKRARRLEAILSHAEKNSIVYLKALFEVKAGKRFVYELHRDRFAWLDGDNAYACYKALKARAAGT